MEPSCRVLLEKYIRSDSVLACLELAGYTSRILIQNIDNNQIDQIENFVRHACSVMSNNNSRLYLGSVFHSNPSKFCFPIGVRMGIMLAVNELKSVRGVEVGTQTMSLITEVHSKIIHEVKEIPESTIDLTKDEVPSGLEDLLIKDVGSVTSSFSSPHQATPSLAESHALQLQQLREHASASAVRLVARTFINAYVVKDQDFSIDMEIADSQLGPPRITGIFHCYLCQERRTRFTSVRFSISRNRYPVMSNVLSHLKMHFTPRPSISYLNKPHNSLKRENTALSDSSAGIDSLSSFNLDNLLTSNINLSFDHKS